MGDWDIWSRLFIFFINIICIDFYLIPIMDCIFLVCCFSFLCCLVYWFLVLVSGFVFYVVCW